MTAVLSAPAAPIWVESTDGVYKSEEKRIRAGDTTGTIVIDPYGENGIDSRKDYRIVLRSDDDTGPNSYPKLTGTVSVRPLIEQRTSATARIDGEIDNNIGIWWKFSDGNPDGRGQAVYYFDESSGPWRAFLDQKPGYEISPTHLPANDNDGKYMFNLHAGDDLVVEYLEACYRLRATASPAAGGSIDVGTPTDCDLPGYRYGGSVSFSAQPAPGYRFDGWRGDVSGSATSATLTMDDDMRVIADFIQVCRELSTAVTNGQGTIEVNTPPNCDDGRRYLDGTTVNLLAIPDASFDFELWGGDATDSDSRFAAVEMDSDKHVTASFNATDVTQGDVSCDNNADVIDALFILRYDVGELAAATQCPLDSGKLNVSACDVNGDSACNVVDALALLQCDVGIPSPACPGVAATQTNIDGTGASAKLFMGPPATQVDGSVMVQIIADVDEGRLGAMIAEIGYDPTRFELLGCSTDPGDILDLAACNPRAESEAPDQQTSAHRGRLGLRHRRRDKAGIAAPAPIGNGCRCE